MDHTFQPLSTLEATPEATPANPERRSWAPWWHTSLLVLLLLLTSWGAALQAAAAAAKPKAGSHIAEYIGNIVFEWLLVLYIWWGFRLRRRTMFEAIGRGWKTTEDALRDLAIAAGFWLVSAGALVLLQKALGIASKQSLQDRMRAMQFISPRTAAELALFLLLAVSAGVTEEIMFRAYLQRQFIWMTRNAAIGIALSAALFGVAHSYQGAKMVVVLGCYGAMFGVLAHFRRSVIPGMIAHAGQDSLFGLAAFFMRNMPALK